MTLDSVEASLGAAFGALPEAIGLGLAREGQGSLDRIVGGRKVLLVASDRLWGFDRVLATIPFKGELSARLSAFWFDACADILPNYLLEGPASPAMASTGRACLVRKVDRLPFAVRVRGFLAGQAWEDYRNGGPVCGLSLPEGLMPNERFPIPLLGAEWRVGAGKSAENDLWPEIETACLALFRRGQEMALRAGLILVDSLYEFGLMDGRLCLCGDPHGLETSHYWWAEGYPSYASEEAPRSLDSEPWKAWLAEQGFAGEGDAPIFPARLKAETGWRMIQAFETITGDFFEPRGRDPQAEAEAIERIVRREL